MPILEREQLVPHPRSTVFAFFADARNLERLTPAQLRFHILTPQPIVMRAGTVIDYRLQLFGVGFLWRTLIESFEPESAFVDLQLKGPYRLWRHRHEFIEVPGGTLVRDHVTYRTPFGPLGELARRLFIERQLRRIFDFRRATIAQLDWARVAS